MAVDYSKVNMSLMPLPHVEQSYTRLCKKFAGSAFEGTLEQTFRIVYNRENSATSVDKLCVIDGISGCKFWFHASFQCNECNNYRQDPKIFDQCICSTRYAKVSFTVRNAGVNVEGDFDLGIEKPDLSINRVSKETTKLFRSQAINAFFALQDPKHHLNRDEGEFFTTGGTLTFVLEIKNIKADGILALPAKPEYPGVLAKLAEQFSERCIDAASPPDNLVDVTLHVKEHKIYAHKIILTLSSNYFSRMFASNMKEATDNEVYLHNTDFNTLKTLLKFMYKDTVDENIITLELLRAADFYEVMRLRSICSNKLSNTINFENVGAVWETAYMYNIQELTEDCVIYMARNWKHLLKDEKIRQLCKKHYELPMTISALLSETYPDSG